MLQFTWEGRTVWPCGKTWQMRKKGGWMFRRGHVKLDRFGKGKGQMRGPVGEGERGGLGAKGAGGIIGVDDGRKDKNERESQRTSRRDE